MKNQGGAQTEPELNVSERAQLKELERENQGQCGAGSRIGPGSLRLCAGNVSFASALPRSSFFLLSSENEGASVGYSAAGL